MTKHTLEPGAQSSGAQPGNLAPRSRTPTQDLTDGRTESNLAVDTPS
jgi:hypothetical protein